MSDKANAFARLVLKLHQEHWRVNQMQDGVDREAYKDGLYFAEKLILEEYESMRKPLAKKIIEVKEKLEADEKQMARHLKLSLEVYKDLESGARILPLPAKRNLERRMEGLLERCGLR